MRFVTLDGYNKVIGIRYAEEIVEGEIKSDVGNIGQIMQQDGTFLDDTTPPPAPQPSLEDKVNYLYYKSKGLI